MTFLVDVNASGPVARRLVNAAQDDFLPHFPSVGAQVMMLRGCPNGIHGFDPFAEIAYGRGSRVERMISNDVREGYLESTTGDRHAGPNEEAADLTVGRFFAARGANF